MTAISIRSDLLSSFKHGFFGRRGGVSTGVYASLNCRRGSSDPDSSTEKNRRVAAESIGTDIGSIATLYQVHSAKVVEANSPIPRELPRADALVSKTPGIALGILTADCLPVLFADPIKRIVGAAHAGWRGSLAGILQNTVKAMEDIGSDAKNISAAVGPCISQRNYEVGEDFFDEFFAENREYARYFARGPRGEFIFDLPGFSMDRIRESGVENVNWVGICTYGNPEEYFSYRRSLHVKEKDFGCQISLVAA